MVAEPATLPKVSIIIPFVHDRGWLKDALNSIEAQNYSQDLIEVLLEKSPNSVGYNINRGVERATGTYIKYFAEDDWLESNCIKDSVKFLQANPQFQWMHANSYILHDDGPRKGLRQYHIPPFNPTFEQLLTFNHIHGGTVMYHADVFKLHRFDESLWTGEEYDFYLKIYKAGYLPGYLDKYVFNYRRHAAQKSLGNTDPEYQAQRKAVVDQIRGRYRS